jgi:hypothetical protein
MGALVSSTPQGCRVSQGPAGESVAGRHDTLLLDHQDFGSLGGPGPMHHPLRNGVATVPFDEAERAKAVLEIDVVAGRVDALDGLGRSPQMCGLSSVVLHRLRRTHIGSIIPPVQRSGTIAGI